MKFSNYTKLKSPSKLDYYNMFVNKFTNMCLYLKIENIIFIYIYIYILVQILLYRLLDC